MNNTKMIPVDVYKLPRAKPGAKPGAAATPVPTQAIRNSSIHQFIYIALTYLSII
jgi:hypothetical protein